MSEAEAATSSSEATSAGPPEPAPSSASADKHEDDFMGPTEAKRSKIVSKNVLDKKYKLEDRLGGILCCAVCLDLPRAAVYQVSAVASTFFLNTHYYLIASLCHHFQRLLRGGYFYCVGYVTPFSLF